MYIKLPVQPLLTFVQNILLTIFCSIEHSYRLLVDGMSLLGRGY